MIDLFPYYRFFMLLRDYPEFSVGIDDYDALITFLEKKPDEHSSLNRERILNICKMLWFKPNNSFDVFEKLFNQSFVRNNTRILNLNSDEITEESIVSNIFEEQNSNHEVIQTDIIGPELKIPQNTRETSKQGKLFVNFDDDKGELTSSPRTNSKFQFRQNYHFLNDRQLRQKWRLLSISAAYGSASNNELDIEETVDFFAKKGYIIEPLKKSKKYKSHRIIFLVDHRGSMTAFRGIVDAIIQNAQAEISLDCQIYFFRNIPEQLNHPNSDENEFYVFKERGHYSTRLVVDILKDTTNTSFVIISDAGAASSSFNVSRIETTERLLKLLFKHTFKVAWLNPMPQDRWVNSSADIIRDLIDMAEATPEGLSKIIPVLKGVRNPHSAILFPDLILESLTN